MPKYKNKHPPDYLGVLTRSAFAGLAQTMKKARIIPDLIN